MLSKINPTTVEALMMRLTAIEEKQDTLMGEIATFEGTYLDDLAAANAAITTI